MELLQLRYFQMTAELGSVSQSAKYFNIPQSSMSQTLARLEASLGGVKLFDRRNGRIYLNDNGRLFLKYVNRSLYELDNGINAVTSGNGKEIAGNIKIKIMENHRLVMTCIPEFSELHPDVSFSIVHGYQEDNDVTYDMCITSSMEYKNMSLSIPLLKEHIVLATHKNNPLASKRKIKIDDLKDQKLITLPCQSSLYQITGNACREHGFEPHFSIICDDPYFVRKYIDEELGVSLVPEVSWRGRFRENTVLVPVDGLPILTSYIVMDSKRYPAAAVTAFRDYLVKKAREMEENLL